MSTAYVPPPGTQRTGTDTVRADALRAQIESTLGDRFAGALSPAPRPVRETIPTGIEALDEMLEGGVPLGAITELVGPLSSGRTGVALSTIAAAMREGSMCAWVDASDAFDPESAAANGVCLEQLLWVRCGVMSDTGSAADVGQGGITQQGGGSRARAGQHPRDEVRGLDKAVGELLREGSGPRDRTIGTPGAPNRPLVYGDTGEGEGRRAYPTRSFGPVEREEQVSSDRQPKRGRSGHQAASEPAKSLGVQPGSVTATHARGPAGSSAASGLPASAKGFGAGSSKPWARLDQALRAADLLLQAGGFRVLVLDLGSVAPEHALRIPLATWFRFRAAADANRTVLLALTQTSCARSSAGLVVCFHALEVQGVPALAASRGTGEATASGHAAAAATAGGHGLHVVESKLVEGRADRELSDQALAVTGAKPSRIARPASEAKLIAGIRYQAQPLRQRFTPTPNLAKASTGARRQPMATWQLSAYPVREQA